MSLLRSYQSDASDPGNSLTRFTEYACECDKCGGIFTSYSASDVSTCAECEQSIEETESQIRGERIEAEIETRDASIDEAADEYMPTVAQSIAEIFAGLTGGMTSRTLEILTSRIVSRLRFAFMDGQVAGLEAAVKQMRRPSPLFEAMAEALKPVDLREVQP